MNKQTMKGGLACLALTMSFQAAATLQHTTATVSNLRVEGSYGFVGVSQSIPNCGDRVWMNMTVVQDRVAYATAMMAMTTGKTVVVRAHDDGERVYGACKIYDIYVTQ